LKFFPPAIEDLCHLRLLSATFSQINLIVYSFE
jgi:hypothetical protein